MSAIKRLFQNHVSGFFFHAFKQAFPITASPMRIKTQDTGRLKKIVMLPWLSFKARRNSPSNMEPNTRPSTMGSGGKTAADHKIAEQPDHQGQNHVEEITPQSEGTHQGEDYQGRV